MFIEDMSGVISVYIIDISLQTAASSKMRFVYCPAQARSNRAVTLTERRLSICEVVTCEKHLHILANSLCSLPNLLVVTQRVNCTRKWTSGRHSH